MLVSRKVWPLAALTLGLPLWWVLGLAALAPVILAVPMAVQLVRARPIRLPAGLGWWLLFLAWVVLGLLVLSVDAPGAVPGGGGGSRMLVFGLRLSWYLACTVALLWVTNLDRMAVPDRTVHMLLAVLFVAAAGFGMLGVIAPALEFRSAIEYVLPAGLRNNGFVASLVHPETADVQEVLGAPLARPKAPFPYTNTWGSVIALSAVFLVAAVWGAKRSVKLGVVAVVGVAAVPIAFSLNRGLWVSLVLCVVGGLVLLGVRRGPKVLAAGLVLVALAALVVWSSPLRDLAEGRVENQHSNGRRGQLLTETVNSVSEGSPIVGFGSTRDVQGSFSSIAGGETPSCPACGVPPLGTQGHLWLVLFSQGWLGLAFFLIFVVMSLVRSARCRTVNEIVCFFVVGVFVLQLAIYDTLGLPLMMIMIAIGLVARERIDAGTAPSATSATLTRELHRGAWVLAACAVLGAAVGGTLAAVGTQQHYRGEVAVAVSPAPLILAPSALSQDPDDPRAERRAPTMSLDTEVAILLSPATVDAAATTTGVESTDLRDMIAVSAVPNSHVLEIGVTADSATQTDTVADAVAQAFLTERTRYLEQRRDDVVDRLDQEIRSLGAAGQSRGGELDPSTQLPRQQLLDAMLSLKYSPPDEAHVVRQTDADPVARPLEAGVAAGLGLGLLVGLIVITVRPPAARRPRRLRHVPTPLPTHRGGRS